MTGDPRAVRELAQTFRRAADRLVLLRLRLAHRLAGPTDAAEAAGPLGRWSPEHAPRLGELAGRLRGASRALLDAAEAIERTHGSRLGGYGGAGYLGSGDEAVRRLRASTRQPRERSGTGEVLGGLAAGLGAPVLPGRAASHRLGLPTPEPRDEE